MSCGDEQEHDAQWKALYTRRTLQEALLCTVFPRETLSQAGANGMEWKWTYNNPSPEFLGYEEDVVHC